MQTRQVIQVVNGFFYPFCFITTGQTVKETGAGLFNMQTKVPYMETMFKGKRLQTVIKEFKKANQFCLDNNIECDSLEFEEILINNILN